MAISSPFEISVLQQYKFFGTTKFIVASFISIFPNLTCRPIQDINLVGLNGCAVPCESPIIAIHKAHSPILILIILLVSSKDQRSSIIKTYSRNHRLSLSIVRILNLIKYQFIKSTIFIDKNPVS